MILCYRLCLELHSVPEVSSRAFARSTIFLLKTIFWSQLKSASKSMIALSLSKNMLLNSFSSRTVRPLPHFSSGTLEARYALSLAVYRLVRKLLYAAVSKWEEWVPSIDACMPSFAVRHQDWKYLLITKE